MDILNPITYPSWNDLVLSTKNCSIFHSSNWARVIHEAYGYKPLYFASISNGRMLFLMPCMEIKSSLTGKRGVSLPFTDYCEPIITEWQSFQDLMNYLIEYGKKTKWTSIEMRTENSLSPALKPSSFYYGHTLNLSQGEELIFSNLRESTKRNIKKAMKEGVRVNILNSLESVKEFYHLNCMTRKEHGLPPQPYIFFKKIHEHIISKNMGFVVLSSHNDKNISGAVFFYFGDKAIYKYGASDKKYQNLRANNLVMWEAIRRFSQNGNKSLSFGRTEPENKGLLQFKAGWRAKEYTINYYKYDIKKAAFIDNSNRVTGFYNQIFRIMPIPLLKMTGSLLYKHLG